MMPPFKPHAEDYPYLRRLAWTIAIALLLVLIWRASDLILMAFGSVIGAVVFRSAGRLFRTIGVRSWHLALGLGIVLTLALFGAIGYLLTVQFGAEISGMLGNLPGTVRDIERGLGQTPVGHTLVQAVEAAVGGSTIANKLGGVVIGGGEILLNMLIVIVGAMFIAADPAPYRNAIVLLTPPAGRDTMARALDQVTMALRLWLKAKLVSMTAMAILIGASLWFAGLESWAALGLLGGLSEFIPYVGPAIAMLPAVGIAAAAGGDLLWRTLVAYLAVRAIEAALLTPLINRRVVRIPPALTLFTILGAGAVFGIYGVFFAGALLVVAYVGVREIYLRDTLGEDIRGIPEKAKDGRKG